MLPRERLLAAFTHTDPDRVPLDLGSTSVTGIHVRAYNRLKLYLNLPIYETKLFDRTSQLAIVEESVLNRLGIDTRGIKPGLPENWSDIEFQGRDAFQDEWGIIWELSPESGSYAVTNSPLYGEISTHDIFNYHWPDPRDPGRTRTLRERAIKIKSQGDWGIVLSLPSDIIMKSLLLRGYYDWFIDAALNQQLLGVLLDQILEIQMEVCGRILDEVGDMVDVVFGFDDLAMQDRLITSPATYRKVLEPRLQRYYEFVQSKTQAKIVHHSDGAIMPVIDSLINMGINAINPLQISAIGFENVNKLKKKYEGELVIWGGVDTHRVLPLFSPNEVKSNVTHLINILNRSGGFVLSSVHSILGDVPPENIVAMFDAVTNFTGELRNS